MRKIGIWAALAALVAGPALAQSGGARLPAYGQPVACYYSGTAQAAVDPSWPYIRCDASGQLIISGSGGGGGSAVALPYNSTGGFSGVTVGTTSAQCLATRTGTQHLLSLDNESTTGTIAINFGGTAAINTAGSFTLPPGTTRTWNVGAVPLDQINCIGSAANLPLTVESN